MVDMVVSAMPKDVVDIIVDFCRICLNFHGVWECTFNYLCLLLLTITYRARMEALCFRLFRLLLPSPTLGTFVGFKL